MADSFVTARGRLGASVLNAKYDKATRTQMNEPGRKAARTKLEESVISEYGLDPQAPDFAYRLQQGISAHYRRLRLTRVRSAK